MRPTRLLFLGTPVLFLVVATVAMADSTVAIRGDTLTVWVNPGNPGKELTREVITATPGFDGWARTIRSSDVIFYSATNDSTQWTVVRALTGMGIVVDEASANQDADGAVNWARHTKARIVLAWAGVPDDKLCIPVPLRDEHCLIKIWGRSLEREVAQYLPKASPPDTVVVDTPTSPTMAYWDLDDDYVVLGLGLETTRHSVAPHATLSLNMGDTWIIQGHGHHQLFIRYDRDLLGGGQSTYDQGAGIRLGRRCSTHLWVLGGWRAEENVLADTDAAGRRTYWYRGAELTSAYATMTFAISVSVLYGHEWSYGDVTDDALGIRAAITRNLTLSGGW